jgi:uracil-DNA glycosylase family 4
VKRRAFAQEDYWGRPIPGWGDDAPAVLVVGLAPAAHGGNRTGRIFTGDASGDFLFAALHRAGLATQPTSTHADDGQRLVRTRMLGRVRCAPPANKPTPQERDTCAPWLDAELAAVLPSVRAAIALGGFAWQALLDALRRAGLAVPSPRPRFGHAAELALDELLVLGQLPSQPAEHLHRQADAADARRRPRPRRAARRGASVASRPCQELLRASSWSAAATSACTPPCGCASGSSAARRA